MATPSADGESRSSILLVRRRDTHPAWTRIALAGMVIAAVLAVFGLPHANLHGLLHYVGVMDPFCGGTRSVYLTLHGRLHEAIRYNPAGPLLVIAASAVLIRAAIGRLSGYWVGVRVPRGLLIGVGIVAVIALEVNQQLDVGLLTQPWAG